MAKPIFLKLILLFFFLFVFSITIYSQNFDTQLNLQDTTQIHLIILKNGDRHKGRILEIKNDTVTFFSKKNKKTITTSLAFIHKIQVQGHLDGKHKKYRLPFQYTQYVFFANSAFNIKRKEKNYRTFLGASMLLDYGITDGFSVGVAYSFPFFLAANLKFSGNLDSQLRVGYKSQYVVIPTIINDGERFGILENTLMMTFGSPDRFFNIAVSNYWTKRENFFQGFEDFIPSIYNSVSIGGGYRLSERWQFIFENHINFNQEFLDAKILPSIGLSYATRKFNIAFGFQSFNQRGFNVFPLMDISTDDLVSFSPQFLSRLPYLTYSKIF